MNMVVAKQHSSSSSTFEPFDDKEVNKGLAYLENEENKVMVSDGIVYVI